MGFATLYERFFSSTYLGTKYPMARTPNSVDTSTLKLSTTPQICRALDDLVATGIFGKTRSEVAERLLAEKLREIMLQGTEFKGWVTRGRTGGRGR